MGVRIEQIKVERLGPLEKFQMDLGAVNLIYGKNEQGKTFLVEYLIQSLFKKTDSFKIQRELPQNGSVLVSGLKEKAVALNPKSKDKLEKYLESSNPGVSLPPSLARLLIVRAGELAIDKEGSGISRSILNEYLSNQGFLAKIEKAIPATVQNASFEGSPPQVRIGNFPRFNNPRTELAKIGQYYASIRDTYSEGRLAELRTRLQDAEEAWIKQDKARRFAAYQLDRRVQALNGERNRLSSQDLDGLQEKLIAYRQKSSALETERAQLQANETTCQHFPWLTAAVEEYQQLISRTSSPPNQWLVILAGILLIACVLAAFLAIPIGALAAAALSAGLLYVYWRKLKDSALHANAVRELERIAAGFEERFGHKPGSLPDLQQLKQDLAIKNGQAEEKRHKVADASTELASLNDEILSLMAVMDIPSGGPSEREAALKAVRERISAIDGELNQWNADLSGTGVAKSDYLSEDPGIPSDEMAFRTAQDQKNQVKNQLETEEGNLNTLKSELAGFLQADFRISWAELIAALDRRQAETARAYKEIAAQVYAGITLKKKLDFERTLEEQIINTGLQQPVTGSLLQILTGNHYDKARAEGEQLWISGKNEEFLLNKLSTGTQEQILLGLRIAFATQLMNQKPMFLILDDAFQHSDWGRREKMVETVLALAQYKNWQILYFSMDDHIRDLFEGRVKQVLKEQYCFKDLSATPG